MSISWNHFCYLIITDTAYLFLRTKETNNAIDLISALYYLTHEYKPETYSGNYYTIEIGDTTIKVFDDEIQIDDILLSIDDSKDFAAFLPKEKQKLIIDFVINIDL